ncbi:hypothetical protein LB577_08305 [Mesorhizobium sp. B283B1A]|uniref:hypothetical protein n=1 Tax=Mesorhizobium TaxID=68287 RepID=UPI001CD0E14C|nr:MULTISPECIES: hypothetical protein [Mesorhizobium]MCA0046957.1 hypothetical protein [Mesorhizobium sp. B283B1A]UQS66634.1 hypothetical protein M5D98_10005 [Mesorhizobium opportunistum]
MLRLRTPLLPRWRYWPAVALAALIAAPIAGLSIPPPPPEKYDSDKSPEKERTDLTPEDSTDEKLADYTLWLVFVTAGLGVVAAFQTKLLSNSDRTANKLVGIAERQMLITGRQTDIIDKQHAVGRLQYISARDNAKRELRAYLTVEPDGINQLIGKMAVIGQVRLRNVGRLPARSVTLIVKMKRSAKPEKDPRRRTKDFNASEDRTTYSDRVVNPGGDMLQGSEDVLPIADLAVDHYNVYVFGIAKYDNGYGDPCFTRFCHRYSTDGRHQGLEMSDPPKSTRIAIGREKARYHSYGNNAEPSEDAIPYP